MDADFHGRIAISKAPSAAMDMDVASGARKSHASFHMAGFDFVAPFSEIGLPLRNGFVSRMACITPGTSVQTSNALGIAKLLKSACTAIAAEPSKPKHIDAMTCV